MAVLVTVLAVVLALLTVLVAGLLRSHAEILRALHNLGAGIDPEAYVAYEKDWYDGSIRGMDAEIGRLRQRLGELGLDRRTLVAFVSDHGEEFLEHGRMFHQQSVYGELANVPLFLWWPGTVRAGVRVPETV